MLDGSVFAAGQVANVEEASRCRGVTTQGVRCKWSAVSDDPVAAPLRTGGNFCFWHAPRKKTRSVVVQEDARQQRLEIFFANPLTSASSALAPTPSLALARSSVASGDAGVTDASQKPKLTPEQFCRIAENRQKALVRRASKLEGDAAELSQTQPQPQTTQEHQAGASQELSQAQLDRISQNRLEAIGRRLKRHDTLEQNQAELAASQDHDAWASQELSQAQLDRITKSRQEALERRRQRHAVCASPRPAVCSSQAAPSAQVAPCASGLSGDIDEVAQNLAASQKAARSRTPERRPRRQLAVMVTGSPPPLPTHLMHRVLTTALLQQKSV